MSWFWFIIEIAANLFEGLILFSVFRFISLTLIQKPHHLRFIACS